MNKYADADLQKLVEDTVPPISLDRISVVKTILTKWTKQVWSSGSNLLLPASIPSSKLPRFVELPTKFQVDDVKTQEAEKWDAQFCAAEENSFPLVSIDSPTQSQSAQSKMKSCSWKSHAYSKAAS